MIYTTSYPQENSGGGCAGVLILVLAGITLFFGAALMIGPTLVAEDVVAISIPPIVYSEHAMKHGVDATAVRECLNKNGASEIWRGLDKKTFYLLCQLPDGRWGLMSIIRDAIDKLWHEQTSFVPDNPSRQGLINYLEQWGTKFNGPFPWQ